MIIVLDPGHGGSDPGAVDPVQPERQDMLYSEEDDITYDITQKVANLLRILNHTVYITRKINQLISLKGRADFANRLKADIFVSIHVNACGTSDPKQLSEGIETFCFKGKELDKGGQLRDLIHKEIIEAFPTWKDRGLKSAKFAVLRHTIMPASLIECGFITNETDEILLSKPEIREKFALSITKGIINYLGKEEKING